MGSVPQPLTIAQVTPQPLGSGTGVDRFVRQAAEGLAARGHRVLLVAPSSDSGEINEARAAVRDSRDDPEGLVAPGSCRVLALGEVLPASAAGRRAALPVDVTRAVEELHAVVPLDVCHVHD